jgi:hypothetical protein
MRDPIFSRNDGVWLNEPERWAAQRDSLQIVMDKTTDFWRKTHYGFNRDSGHFLWFSPPSYACVASCLNVAPHFATRASCCLVTCQITKW